MAEGYQYDVFISYRRRPFIQDWVRNHFHPLLEQWLPEHHHSSTKIFVDDGIETGDSWPDALRQAIAVSRCLVAVWSPGYFRSPWCLAELHTMLARESVLGFRKPGNPKGLVYPVLLSDGEHFPANVKAIQRADFRDYNTPHQVFRETIEYVKFDKAIQALSRELSGMISRAPQWQSGWPVMTPPAPLQTPPELPRL